MNLSFTGLLYDLNRFLCSSLFSSTSFNSHLTRPSFFSFSILRNAPSVVLCVSASFHLCTSFYLFTGILSVPSVRRIYFFSSSLVLLCRCCFFLGGGGGGEAEDCESASVAAAVFPRVGECVFTHKTKGNIIFFHIQNIFMYSDY